MKKNQKSKLRLNLTDSFITTLTVHQSDWILVHFFCIICSNWRSAETDHVDVFFNSYLNMLIRLFSRFNWSDWSLTKVDCSISVRSDWEETVIWDFIMSSIVNSEVLIKSLSIEFNVRSVASDVEDCWSYSLRSDDIIVIACLCKDSSNKESKSETRISS